MKKISILLCAATAIAALSCNKEVQDVQEPQTPQVELKPMTFTATTTETRTVLDEDHVSIKWLSTDKISVWDGHDNREFTSNGEGTKVKFNGEAADAQDYLALYPYDANATFMASSAHTTLAADQEPVNGSFANGLNINAATSADKTTFYFENVMSVAKFTLDATKLGGKTIKSVKFASTYPLAGDVQVQISPEGISASAGSTTVKEVTMTSTSGLADGTYYFVVLPNAGGEITMTFESTDGFIARKTATLSNPFTAGYIKNLGTVQGLVWLKPWSYTLLKTDVNLTTNTLVNTNWNGKNWQVSGPEWFGFDSSNGRGVQFGSGKKPASEVTLSSSFGNGFKVESITVNASGASDISGTVSVKVGSTTLKCGEATTASLTTTATNFKFVVPNNELAEGSIVITLVQTSQKAMYVKSIFVNSDPEDEPGEVVTLESLRISDNVKKAFKVGDVFSLGDGSVTAYYSDGSSKDVTSLVTVSGFDSSEIASSQTITLSYSENGSSASVSYDVVIRSNTVQTYSVTYTVGTVRKVNITSGTAPAGSSESFVNTYTTANQITGGKSQTLTLSGYTGAVIKGITLSMHSNSKSGSGHFTCYAGNTLIAGFTDNKYWREWYNIDSWSTSFTDVFVEMINDEYEIKENEQVVIKIEASANSLFNQSFTLTYEL